MIYLRRISDQSIFKMSWQSSRRDFMIRALGLTTGVGALGVAAAATTGHSEAQAVKLGDLATQKGFHFGRAGSEVLILSNDDFNFREATQGYMIITASTSPDPRDWSFAELSGPLYSAQANNQQAGALHLVWGYNGVDSPRIPSWVPTEIESNGGDPMPTINRYIAAMTTYVRDTFPNVVRWFTAVNEPLNPQGAYEDYQWPSPNLATWTNYFNNASAQYYGDPRTYIVESFKTALRETSPQGKQTSQTFLLINEWHAEQPDTPKGEAYLQLVDYLIGEGIPANRIGVGFQMHLWPGRPSYENGLALRDSNEIAQFASNFRDHAKRFPAGPYVTEMDIDTSGWTSLGYSDDQIIGLAGETYYAITKALADAGGHTLISFKPDDFETSRDNPASPHGQMMKAISELPDRK